MFVHFLRDNSIYLSPGIIAYQTLGANNKAEIVSCKVIWKMQHTRSFNDK
ncbi:protein of unknown function [Xenorhabdus poinarii G6]|uniref:Uncharacterized protein n=1 Tax=Xenorhabdus poinarii G6 TaxID=1354304 RepID=A0A068QYL3_9GAMM|nr:protein of unknown function [Xenorhabdus poinarii G6]